MMRRLLRMAERVLQSEGVLIDRRTLYKQLGENLERAKARRAQMLGEDPTLERQLQHLKATEDKNANSKSLHGGSQSAFDNYNALKRKLEPLANLTDLITAMEYALRNMNSITKIPLLDGETVDQALSRFRNQEADSEQTRYERANEERRLTKTIKEEKDKSFLTRSQKNITEAETKLKSITAQIDEAEATKQAASDQVENTERYMRAVQLANCDVNSPDDVSRAVAHQK